MKTKQNYKFEDFHKEHIFDALAAAPFTQKSQKTIKKEFDKKFRPLTITDARISQLKTENIDTIWERMIGYGKDVVKQCPIATTEFRVSEFQKLYDRAYTIENKVRILRAAKAEIGDDIAKLADAIRNAGGDNIVNIGITGVSSEELERLTKESAGILGFKRTADRF